MGTLTRGEIVRELPRHAHDLSRRAVSASQRTRLLEAIAEAVAVQGYADASVADAIAIAGVSRKTFYEQFRDKEHCFLVAFEQFGDRLLERVVAAGDPHPPGPARRRALLERLLHALADEPVGARVFLVDALGVGPKAQRVHHQLGQKFGRAFFGDVGDLDGITRVAIVGGVSLVLRLELAAGRVTDLPVLLDLLDAYVERALPKPRGRRSDHGAAPAIGSNPRSSRRSATRL